MHRRSLAAGAVATLALVGPLVFVLGTGAGAGSIRPGGSVPTATPSDTTSADGSETAAPVSGPRVAFSVDRIETCGRTCRDVTSTLGVEGAAASNVTVTTRIYAGSGTDGDVVWRGRERVGDLAAGESYTTTERVDLSVADALAVEGAGGRVTVETTVRSAERTATFTRRRDVS